MIYRAELLKQTRVESLLNEAEELCRILARSIATAKKPPDEERDKPDVS